MTHKYNYHAYYSGPMDHEFDYLVPSQYANDPELLIHISAVGGGTVGEAYARNAWAYSVTLDGVEMLHGDDLTSGRTPATHEESAKALCSFLSAAGESLWSHNRSSEYWGEYTADERDFLIDTYERFSLASMEDKDS